MQSDQFPSMRRCTIIAACERQIDRTRAMIERGVIQLTRLLPRAPECVWKALTDPKLHARWWAGNVHPLVGHQFTLDMHSRGLRCRVPQRTRRPGRLAQLLARGARANGRRARLLRAPPAVL